MGATKRTLMQGLRQWLGYFMLLCAWFVALPASAQITAGTISFETGHGSFADVSSDYNGLRFTGEWVYYPYADLPGDITNKDGDAITATDFNTGNATIKSANGTDRFNLTSVKIVAYGVGMTQFTFAGYRNGSPTGLSDTVTVTGSMATSFVPVTLTNMTNVDEVRVSNTANGVVDQGDPQAGNFAFDDLVVAPYVASLSLSPTTLSAATVAAAYNQTITASGGTSPYTYAVTAGALPAGVTLSSAGVLSGTPTAGGSFNFTITATDSTGGTAVTGSQAYTLTVNAPTISVSPTSLPEGTLSVAYSQAITASGGTAPYTYAITAGALPTGLSLSSGGSLSGTPGAAGTFNFTVTASDSSGGTGPYTGARAYALTILAAPTATTGAASTITASGATLGGTVSSNGASTTVTFDYGLTDSYGSSATASQSPLAAGASGSSVSAAITGLTCNTTYHFRVKAVNSIGTTNGSDATFTTSACVPTATTGTATSITASGATLGGTVSSNGGSTTVTFEYGLTTGYGASATASQSPLSAGASNSSVSAAIASLSCGTTYHFRATATNSAGTTYGSDTTFATTACSAPGAPTIGTATAGNAQASVTFTPPASDGGSAITSYTATSDPGNITGSCASSPCTVTGLTNGTAYTFTVTATNGVGTGAASAASNSVTPKAPQTITFSNPGAQNFGTTPTLTATASSNLTPTFSSGTTGVCTITSGGALTFVTAGSCTINADQAGDGSYLPATQVSQTFTVNPVVPGAPTGVSATAGNGQATVSFTAPVSSGGSAITGYTVTSSPGGFTATGTSSPIVVTGLTNGQAYTFTVTATNAAGTGTASTASSAVTPTDAPPVASAVTATVAYGSSGNAIPLALSGATATSVAVASAPAHGTATASGTSISYTPNPTYSGSDSFTYTATNAGGTSAPATVTITVNPQAPVAGNVSLTVDVNSTNNVVPLNLSGGAAASVAIATAPSHGVATVSGTSITYTPTSGYIGADSFTYTATNVTDTSAPGTVTLLIQSRPDPTKDAEVTGLVNAQVTVANRFAQAQIGNFQSHLEGLHRHSRGGAAGGRSLSSRRSPTDPWSDATTDDAANSDNADNTNTATSTRALSGRAFSGKRAVSATTSGRDSVTSTSAQPGNILATSTGLDGFVLPQTKNNAGTPSLASLLPWSLTSLNLAGKHGDILGNGLEVWTAGVINIGKQSDTDTRFTTSGISIGADQRLGEDLTVGIGAGFGHERQKIGDNGTRNDGDSYSFVVYGSYQPTDAIFLDGLIGYGDIEFDSTRYVTALGDKARSARRGAQWFSSLSGGYDYLVGKSLLSTYGRFDLVSTRLKRSTETGGGIYNLTYFEQSSSTKKFSIGVRGETRIDWSTGSVKPYFRVEYQHNLDTPESAKMAYADQLVKVYELEIDGVDRDTLVLGLGGDLLLKKDLRLGLGYRYSHGSESTRMHALRFDLRKAF